MHKRYHLNKTTMVIATLLGQSNEDFFYKVFKETNDEYVKK